MGYKRFPGVWRHGVAEMNGERWEVSVRGVGPTAEIIANREGADTFTMWTDSGQLWRPFAERLARQAGVLTPSGGAA